MGEPDIPEAVVRFLKDNAAFEEFSKGLSKETKRGAVLVACSALDAILKDLLFCRLETNEMNSKEITELDRAVKNFTTKVSLCLGLGLLHRSEAKALTTLNDVRNKFAHRWNVSFRDHEIQEKCKKLGTEFNDNLQKSEEDIAFDKFGYTSSDLMRKLIARVSGLLDGIEYAHSLQKLKIHREYIPMWSPQ